MSRWTILLSSIAVAAGLSAPCLSAAGLPVGGVGNPTQNALVFDSESKEYTAKAGDTTAPFTFIVTNVSATNVLINSLRTSCGCTVAQLPVQPYQLGPGSNVPINVALDLRGKMGTIVKSVSVDSSAGFRSLVVRAVIPQPAPAPAVAGAAGHGGETAMTVQDRARNIQASLNDRQTIFKGDCRSCHVDKGIGKLGKELYDADCGICHDAVHRAAMVPDLKVPRSERDLKFWETWIADGKPGTLMPAFGAAHGGPLTKEQIDSLAQYLYQNYPRTMPPATTPAAAAPGALKPQGSPTAALPRPAAPLPPAPLPQRN